jgi:cytochrome c-type protein NapC
MKASATLMLTTCVLAFCLIGLAAQAGVDWASVSAKDVVLFYPGQSSWEWVMTPSDHPGAEKFRGGKNCAACHADDEKAMGDLLVSGKKNEASPIPGKPGSIAAHVKFAHDSQNFYVHLEFAEGNQPNMQMDKEFATKVAMMINDGGVPEANRAGCWGMCHDDAAKMPSAGAATRAMYLGKTHALLTRQGGGDALKPADELAKLKGSGYELEYWEARLNPGSAPVAANGIVFDRRMETKPTGVSAQASYSGGIWSVTFARKLHAGAGFKDLAPGKRYTVGFAIHSGHSAGRFHYVSFEHSLVLDQGEADFVVEKK